MAQEAQALVERAFLFTDLQGSTRAWEHAPTVMNGVVAEHDRILREAITAHHGEVFSLAGDAFGAAFTTSQEAVAAAARAQHALARREWPEAQAPRVRMGVHVGPAYPREGNYYGATLNRAARLMSAAHGGQVVVSGEVAAVLADAPWDAVRLRDLGVHRLKDLAEPMTVWQLVVDDLPADFPPLATVDASRVAVPRARTRFVGRDREQATLATWLDDPVLVTIVAAGGTGKTRLAYETALACAGRFPDGVVTVELADGGPSEVLPRALEAVLGDEPLARVERLTDPIGALIDHLADRRTLLVLDNCEHVIDDARALVTALGRSCPESSILASSREPLGVDGERVLRLGPLLPGPAVDLFCDRASAAGRTFADDELVAVRRICEQVEGLPLGIELAASRTSILSPTQIAERLATDIGILRERHSARPGRHRSLEAAIAWSYELLDDDERRLLEALSSFVGGADLDAAEEVGGRVAGDDVLDLLESLVDRSLVGTELVGRDVRFRLPVPVRRFAQSRLRERCEEDEVEKAHFDHYLALAHSAVPAIDVDASPTMVELLTAEHENFLVAIERSLAGGRTGPAARLALTLHTYWEETGHLAEGARALARVVAADPTDPGAVAALGALVPYEAMCGQLASATERAAVLADGLGVGLPPLAEARIRFALGFVHGAAGAWGEAVRTWRRAVDDAAARRPRLRPPGGVEHGLRRPWSTTTPTRPGAAWTGPGRSRRRCSAGSSPWVAWSRAWPGSPGARTGRPKCGRHWRRWTTWASASGPCWPTPPGASACTPSATTWPPRRGGAGASAWLGTWVICGAAGSCSSWRPGRSRPTSPSGRGASGVPSTASPTSAAMSRGRSSPGWGWAAGRRRPRRWATPSPPRSPRAPGPRSARSSTWR